MSENITKEEIVEEFKKNKLLRWATYGVGIVVLVALGYIGYQKLIIGPKNETSKGVIADGVMYLSKDSTELAMQEFEYLVGEYNGYKGGEISQYALGNIYFEQGKYEAALSELQDVEINDTYLMTLAIGTQGDCYSELKNYTKAVEMYVKAATRTDNTLTSPLFYFKAGLNAEAAGNYDEAAKYYTIIDEQYLAFASEKGIEKYIVRAKNKLTE